jgi:hypothetical protein
MKFGQVLSPFQLVYLQMLLSWHDLQRCFPLQGWFWPGWTTEFQRIQGALVGDGTDAAAGLAAVLPVPAHQLFSAILVSRLEGQSGRLWPLM